MAGFKNDIVYGTNVDFRGVKPVVGQFTTDGQLLIGSTVSPNMRVGTLSSSDSSVTITNGAGTIDLSAGMLTKTVTVTSAQIKALAETPIEIIPAPGSGKVINILGGWYKLIVASTPFTDGSDISLLYAADPSYSAASAASNSLVVSAETVYETILNNAYGFPIPTASVQDQNVSIFNFSGMDFAGNAANDNSFVVMLFYRIDTL